MSSALDRQQLELPSSASTDTARDNDRFQDVVGQFPQLKTYNQLVLIFRCSPDIGHESVVAAIRGALDHIINLVPWIGERVVHEAQDGGRSGFCKTVPFTSPLHAAKILTVKDASDVCPSYDELEQCGAPVPMLDGKILCPMPAWPLSYTEIDVGEAPVMVFQLTFIKNGLLLNFSNQHNMVDGVGAYAIFKLLSIVMQGEAIPRSLIYQANMDRRTVIPLLDPGQPLRDHSHLLKPKTQRTTAPAQAPAPAPPPPPPSRWVLFRVLRKSIPSIKRAASHVDQFVDSSIKYVSTNDALCAFYWKRLASTRIRNGSVADPDTQVSKFLRALDARSAVGVPAGYLGQMVYHAATRCSYRELAAPELTLSALASRLRADLNASNTEWAVRSYATFVAGVPDKSALVYGGGFDPATDVGNSSMSQLDFTALEFGLLGRPTFLRRPNLTPVPGVMYVLPPEGEAGDLPVLLCLPEKDIDGLRADEEWGPSTEYVG
ncbi:hypothetical protein VPNG_05258 [Cytospora leucostoma]|uniref:Trichothecene 3-O-acetyltransferase-like N-terminal domain-containing protein n=1 Tax=Cytospora leucostoma TaxID=1230097 RepID=A0A423X7I2_9PEZI|nr:hypothetical protein VPNG_05258 [Cytospora leucostoma]